MTAPDAARPASHPSPGRAALRRYRDWAILAGIGIAALTGLIWIGLVLFPLMSWDVYETGRLLIVGILSGLLAVAFGDRRAYAKGKADGYQHGHDIGWQGGWDARDADYRAGFGIAPETLDHPLGFPHSDMRSYTTEQPQISEEEAEQLRQQWRQKYAEQKSNPLHIYTTE